MKLEHIYLILHAISTFGIIFAYVIHLERRLTRIETILKLFLDNTHHTKKT